MNDSTHDDHDDHDGGESISLVQAKHLAPGLGRQARNLFRSRYRIQPTGPVHEPGACEGPADPDALAEALGGYRLAMTPGRLEHAAGRLGVSAEFLATFEPGWVDELGCLAIGTTDEAGFYYGIEAVGIEVPVHVVLDVGVLHGWSGRVAFSSAEFIGAPLLVDSDWKALAAHWTNGGNTAWRVGDASCSDVYRALIVREGRLKCAEAIEGQQYRQQEGPGNGSPSAPSIAPLKDIIRRRERKEARRHLSFGV
jgi:hypothetical protein